MSILRARGRAGGREGGKRDAASTTPQTGRPLPAGSLQQRAVGTPWSPDPLPLVWKAAKRPLLWKHPAQLCHHALPCSHRSTHLPCVYRSTLPCRSQTHTTLPRSHISAHTQTRTHTSAHTYPSLRIALLGQGTGVQVQHVATSPHKRPPHYPYRELNACPSRCSRYFHLACFCIGTRGELRTSAMSVWLAAHEMRCVRTAHTVVSGVSSCRGACTEGEGDRISTAATTQRILFLWILPGSRSCGSSPAAWSPIRGMLLLTQTLSCLQTLSSVRRSCIAAACAAAARMNAHGEPALVEFRSPSWGRAALEDQRVLPVS
eukprot:365704-Chlamydomonas_euryale.AAC.14